MSYQQPGGYQDPNWPSQGPGYDPNQPASAVPGGHDPISGAPGYGYEAGYAQQQYPYQGAQPRGTNTMALTAMILSLVGIATCITAPIGAIMGHVAKKQIRETGEEGDGMATAGIIIGWIITGLMLLVILFYVVVIVAILGAASSSGSGI